MALVKYETRTKIAKQSLDEKNFAYESKRPKITNWHKNEDLYYSKKILNSYNRANVNLNEAQSFVQTFLSKINTPFNFKYIKGEEADLEPAKITNAIKDKDAKIGNWNYKALLARTQLVIYGRYIFEYHADSLDKKYDSHLTNVDVYQFLIDPSCGGEDIEKAWYMGRGGITKSRTQLEEGMRKGIYLRTETTQLLGGAGDADSYNEVDQDAENRYVQIIQGNKVMQNKDVYKFWEWYTTFEGTRYYVLLNETGTAIRVVPLKELFATEKYPFWTVAAYPDLTEFWTLSPMDGVREPILAKQTSINQLLDNAEAINRPMKAYNVDAVVSPDLLKYRADGLIPVKNGFNVQQDIQVLPVSPLTTPIQVYDKLSNIVDVNSGVNAGTKGNSDEDKVGIYEGNQANAADRFALIWESEANGQKRFAELYLDGLDEHLTSKVAIEMIGLDGVEYKEVSKKDIKRGKNFDIMVVTAGSEIAMEQTEKRNKLTFITNNKENPVQNPKVAYEMEAAIAGFSTDEIKQLQEKDYGNAELMAECARDIQNIIAGKEVQPNLAANTAYAQKVLDFTRDNSENLKQEKIDALYAYLDALQPIILNNTMKAVDTQLSAEGLPTQSGQAMGLTGQALTPELAGMAGTPAQPPGATPAPSPEPIQY